MKYKDYKFSTSSESINLTYKQAYGYLKDTVSLINNSKFDLFNDDEELSLMYLLIILVFPTRVSPINTTLHCNDSFSDIYIFYIIYNNFKIY